MPYNVLVVAVPVAEIAIPPDPGPPVEGSFYAIVSAGDLPDWPDVLADCARAADVVLPPLKPAGNPIIWGRLEGADGLLVQDAADSVLDERGAGPAVPHRDRAARGRPGRTSWNVGCRWKRASSGVMSRSRPPG